MLAPALSGDRYMPFTAANSGSGGATLGQIYVYDGEANSTTTTQLFPMVPAGAGWQTGANGYPPTSIAPDGRYLYSAIIWTIVPFTNPPYGPPPSDSGVIIEFDLLTQTTTRSWNIGPPWGGYYPATGGTYGAGTPATVDSIKAGPSRVSLHVSIGVPGVNWTSALYTIDRGSGALSQWVTGQPPGNPANPHNSYGGWNHQTYFTSDARYGINLDWIVPTFGTTSDIHYYIFDMVNQTNVQPVFSQPATTALTPGTWWVGSSNSQFYAAWCSGGTDYYPNAIPTHQQVDIRSCVTGAVVSSISGSPWPDTFQYILSNGNILGGVFNPTTGPVGSYGSTVTLTITDPGFNIVSSYTGPYYPGTSNEQPFWLADDESYVLLAINEVGTFNASSERNTYFPYSYGDMRSKVVKLAIPSFAFIGQSNYIYSPRSGGGFGGYGMPGCTEVFEMMNTPVIFTAPPQRQYPREDATGLGGARQKVGRGNPPKSRQFSTRQGFKGTYQ
jgi:hypothetical protein